MLFLVAQTFFLLLVATAIGLVSGWLIWGGSRRENVVAGPEVDVLSTELAEAKAEAEAKAADVARLRRKLKRAVEELEQHASQLEAAEDEIEELRAAQANGVNPLVDGGTSADTADLVARLRAAETTHLGTSTELERLQAEHASVQEQLRLAEAHAAALEAEIASFRSTASTGDERAVEASRRISAMESELAEARTLIHEAADRVSALETQAQHWQGEADRVQALLNEANAAHAEAIGQAQRDLAGLKRDHETALTTVRMEASNSRLRADAAAEQLSHLQREFRSLQERSFAHLEATRSAMADLDRQLSATHSTLNDTNPKQAEQRPSTFVGGGNDGDLLALPGMTDTLLANLHELGVSSIVDVANWSADDAARIGAWLPENPNIISENDWVAIARSRVRDGASSTGA